MKKIDNSYTYIYPSGQIIDLIATNDKKLAEQYIAKGYTLFTVPQMFGMEVGQYVLYREQDAARQADALEYLRRYEKESRDHFNRKEEENV